MKRICARAFYVLAATLAVAITSVEAGADVCSKAKVAGNWAYTYTGTILTASGPVPVAAVGHFHQDADGNIVGSQARSVAGASGMEDISGTVSVKRDCTSSGTLSVFVNGQLQRTAVLVGVYDSDGNHGRLIFQSLTLPNGTNVPVVITIDTNRLSFRQ